MTDREMFETYKEQVFRLCYCIMQNRSDAEDICQEVFVKAILSDRSNVRDLRPWLLKIASNECRKVLKRRKNGRMKERTAFMMADRHPENPIEAGYDQKEDGHEIIALLGCLPEKVREVVALRFGNEMTVPEIADLMEIPEGTVKSRLNKAMKLLRSRVEAELGKKSSGKGELRRWTGFLKAK